MLDWLNQFLTSGDSNFLFETYTRFQQWFTSIQTYYNTTSKPWATSQVYADAMTTYCDWTWHMGILAFLAFCLMAFFFYKIASSFVGFWRMR